MISKYWYKLISKLVLTDSENRTRYEGHLYNLNDNVKPYILAYKSNVKITINWNLLIN